MREIKSFSSSFSADDFEPVDAGSFHIQSAESLDLSQFESVDTQEPAGLGASANEVRTQPSHDPADFPVWNDETGEFDAVEDSIAKNLSAAEMYRQERQERRAGLSDRLREVDFVGPQLGALVDFGDSVAEGVAGAVHSFAGTASVLSSAPLVLADKALGTETTDWFYKNITDPLYERSKKHREKAAELNEFGGAVGAVGVDLAAFAVAPELKGVDMAPQVANATKNLVTSPVVRRVIADGIENMAKHLPGAILTSTGQSGDLARQQMEQGADSGAVLETLSANFILNTLGNVAPVGVPGNVAVRGVTGQAIGTSIELGRQEALHALDPELNPSAQMPDVTNPETYLPGLLAVVFGARDRSQRLKIADDGIVNLVEGSPVSDIHVQSMIGEGLITLSPSDSPMLTPQGIKRIEGMYGKFETSQVQPDAPAAEVGTPQLPGPEGGPQQGEAHRVQAEMHTEARADEFGDVPTMDDVSVDVFGTQGMEAAETGLSVPEQAPAVEPSTPGPEASSVQPLPVQQESSAAERDDQDLAPEDTPTLQESGRVEFDQSAVQGLEVAEVPLDSLVLSEEVPQFKEGADSSGVVEPLGGKFDRRGVAPIQVWERADGTLEIISGRHRFDLAQRSGEETIPAQIHREADGFDRVMAARLDAELNIRDGQGSVSDYANYFRDQEITEQMAFDEGLLARAKGRDGFIIGRDASEETFAAHRAGIITDEGAKRLAEAAPQNSALQAVGLQSLQDGSSIADAVNTMHAVSSMAPEGGAQVDDMFGFDTSSLERAKKMARIASRKQRDIQADISSVSGAARNPKRAQSLGVDVKNPDSVRGKIAELREEKAKWDRWSTNPDLVAEIRAEMGEAPQMPAETEAAPVAEVHEGQGAMFGEAPAEVPAAEVAPAKVEPPTKPPADKAGPITELVMGARADTVRKAARELFREHGVKAPASLSKKEIARALESSGIPYESIAAAVEGRAQDAGKPLLEPYTEAEVAQREASQKQAEQQAERAKAREAAEVKQREEQAAVRQRSEQAAETFELGQSAEDNLSGQANIFDAQPEVQTSLPATKAKKGAPEKSAQATSKKVADAAKEVDTSPSDAQKEAGNYKKGHVSIQGLDIAIENPKGSERSGVDAGGNKWSVKMKHHYGYIKRTEGADGDQVDVFIGSKPDSNKVFVVDQINQKDGAFDEHKVMVGFDSQAEAKSAYEANYNKGWRTGKIQEMSMDEFKQWLQKGDTAKPVQGIKPKQAAKKKQPTKPRRAIENVGEHLEGSRKDQARALSEILSKNLTDEEIASLPLSKLWPKKSIDDIEDKRIAAFATAARDLIPSKPRKSYRLNAWVSKVKTMRSLTNSMLNGELTRESIEEKGRKIIGLEGFFARIDVLEAIDRNHWGRVKDVRDHSKAFRYGEDGKTKIPSPNIQVKIDGRWARFEVASVSDAIGAIKERLGDAAPQAGIPDASRYDIRGLKGSYFINRKGDREYRMLATFESLTDARAYLKNNLTELNDAWEAVKARDNVSKRDVRRKENRARTAKDWRKGKDVTAEQFAEEFGFRGVQFGEWVSQGGGARERQGMINQAYDALMDLSVLLNIPPRAVSLNGSLGLAFGSRGRGSASAHFEPGNLVINLTKTKGAGTLAHEWFHAVDNYFSRQRHGGEVKTADYRESNYITYKPEALYVSKEFRASPLKKSDLDAAHKRHPNAKIYNPDNWVVDPEHPQGVRVEVEKAFADLVDALNRSPMRSRSATLDQGKSDGYWSRIIERGARAFENYVIHKMAQKGYHNDYLANVIPEEAFKRNKERYPYLRENEIEPIAKAFDDLFSTIEHKVDSDGSVILYSRQKVSEAPQSIGKARTEKVVRDALGNEASNVMVVDNYADLPADLRAVLEADGMTPDGFTAVQYKGKSYIQAQYINSEARAQEVVFHEHFAHVGLRRMYGSELGPKLSGLFMKVGGLNGVRDMAKKQGINLRSYEKALADNPGMPHEQKRQVLMEELMAHMAEATGTLRRFIQEVWGAIRDWLRSTGFVELARYNASDLAHILKGAREASMVGANAPLAKQPAYKAQGPRMSRRAEATPAEQVRKVEAEHAEVLRAHDEAGAPLPAPNGEPSQLNRNQWVQVRTDNFKQWFGDWEGSPETSSKVVDANGEPLVVYHGSPDVRGIFDGGFQPGMRGEVFFAAEDYATADSYADDRRAWDYQNAEPQTIPLYLSIKNPMIVDGKGRHWRDTEKHVQEAKEKGHDGIIIRNSIDFYDSQKGRGGKPTTVYAWFKPNQAKSAADGQLRSRFDGQPIQNATGNTGSFDPSNPDIRFSRTNDKAGEQSVEAYKESWVEDFLKQPVDRVFRIPAQIVGGLDSQGRWKPGVKADESIRKAATEWKPKEDGMFGWLNTPLEKARAGLVDRHGLTQEYQNLWRKAQSEERIRLAEAEGILKSLADADVGISEARVLNSILTGETVSEGDMGKLAEPIRVAIYEMGQELVDLGLLSAEAFERNAGAYLHRSYIKHEAGLTVFGKVGRNIGRGIRRANRLQGDQFKGRGIFATTKMHNLKSTDAKDWWGAKMDGKADGHLVGEKFVLFERTQHTGEGTLTLDGIEEGGRKARVLERTYWPAELEAPAKFEQWENRGTWEVRGFKKGDPVLWRDYTKEERNNMGEILDARYNIAKTYQLLAHDIAVGRFYQDVANNRDWARHDMPDDGTYKDVDAFNRHNNTFTGVDWVRVPNTNIPNSTTKRWGALAGMYVRSEIWRDLNQVNLMSQKSFWQSVVTEWKLNKTARSPVVHMNNVMSNFLLMDMADVNAFDLVGGLQSLAKRDAHYEEAMQYGAFGGTLMSAEFKKNVLDPVLNDLIKKDLSENSGDRGTLRLLSDLSVGLYNRVRKLDRKMIDMYQLEDEIFRMATYMSRLRRGDAPEEAARIAREQFIDYDIHAPWVNAARRNYLPFASYSYRAIPLVQQTMFHRPWKMAKLYAVMKAMGMLTYMLMPGDEDRERKALREEQQGLTIVGTPRMMRLPVEDEYGNPMFIDMRRWVPMGDVFDTNMSHSAVPIPSWIQPGGPLMVGMEFVFNRTAFLDQPITDSTDTPLERMGKVGKWAYESWMPSAAYIPGSFYNNQLRQAYRGATDAFGDPYSTPQVLARSIGVKVQPLDVDKGLYYKYIGIDIELRTIQGNMKAAARNHSRGIISDREYERQKRLYERKVKILEERARKLK